MSGNLIAEWLLASKEELFPVELVKMLFSGNSRYILVRIKGNFVNVIV
jgi:hypothetical protein